MAVAQAEPKVKPLLRCGFQGDCGSIRSTRIHGAWNGPSNFQRAKTREGEKRMNKNPSEKDRMPVEKDQNKQETHQTDADLNKRRQVESMAKKQAGQKFVSDEDI